MDAVLVGVEFFVGANVASQTLWPGDATLVRDRTSSVISGIDSRAAKRQFVSEGGATVIRQRSQERLCNREVRWSEVTLAERRKLLLTMLDAVYVDTVDEKAIVAIRPKPAFRPLFEIATTRAGSGVVLINQTPQTQDEPEVSEPCFWWRRVRVELGLKHGLVVLVAIGPTEMATTS